MKYTDNEIVNNVGKISITGNVIPQIWYRRITRANGSPHLLAIAILADVVYWYRPAEERDPDTGMVLGWRKRFHGEYLQRNYAQYEEMFGESRKCIRQALGKLEELGLVKRHIIPRMQNGMSALGNVMYLILDPVQLERITYPDQDVATYEEEISNCAVGNNPIALEGDTYCPTGNNPIALEGDTYCPTGNNPIAPEGNTYCPTGNNPIALEGDTYCPTGNNPIAPEGNTYCPAGNDLLSQREIPIALQGMTYTKNTTENTTKTLNSSSSGKCRIVVPLTTEMSDVIQKVIDHICNLPPQSRIRGFPLPAGEMQEYFAGLTIEEFKQVDEYLTNNTIHSEKAVITALLNARFYLSLQKSGKRKKKKLDGERSVGGQEMQDLEKKLLLHNTSRHDVGK